jgi:hypothetical protein
MYEDDDVQILSILYTDLVWMNREKREHLYKFIINWCACCLSEQDVGKRKRKRKRREIVFKNRQKKEKERKCCRYYNYFAYYQTSDTLVARQIANRGKERRSNSVVKNRTMYHSIKGSI